MRDPITIALLGLAAAIALYAAATGPDAGERYSPRPRSAQMAKSDGPPPEPTLPATSANVDDYDESLRRPLFFEGRKPPLVEPAPELDADTAPTVTRAHPRPSDIELVGIAIENEKKIALLKKRRGGTLESVDKNAQFDGWTIQDITPKQVIIQRAHETKTLVLERHGGASPPKRQPSTDALETSAAAESQDEQESAASAQVNPGTSESDNAKPAQLPNLHEPAAKAP